MSKLEEIARAIAKVYGIEDVGEDWEVFNWQFFGAARAAVEAMREPSDAMIAAAIQSSLEIMREFGTNRLMPDDKLPKPSEVTRRGFNAMCDAILTEAPETRNSAGHPEGQPARDGGER